MYEDLTNILITGVKSERDPQFPDGSTNYQCVYTQRSDATARSKHSCRTNDVLVKLTAFYRYQVPAANLAGDR